MSTQIKCILPLIDERLTRNDISKESGFVNAYLYDQNRPSLEQCCFLLYDNSVRSKQQMLTWTKLRQLKLLRSIKVIYVNKKSYTVYAFQFFDMASKYLFKGRNPKGNQIARILYFWGNNDDDLNNRLFNSDLKIYGVDTSSVPEEDYAMDAKEFREMYKKRVVINK